MAQSNGTTVKNLNDSRAEALHAILNSLSPAAPGNHSEPANLRADQVRKLSDKLGEILGDEVESGDGTRRNENGELVNEEGLPIIDINEPVTAADFAFQPDPSGIFDDPDLLPLWVLSDAERARRKAERERLLDLLEEEEHIQHTRDSEAARERWREEMEKRKEASKTEMENLKRARELQKKMGRALLRNVVESREKADLEKVEQAKADEESATRRISLKPKKSVSFAEDTEDADNEQSGSEKGKGVEWGDVAPGRLRPKEQSPLSNQDRLDRQTMKMHVVERHPNAARPPTPPAPERDSDDESVLGSADSDEGHVVHSDPESEDDEHINTPDSDYDDSEDGLPPDEELTDWGNEDFDYARHQREIALEYYEKRKIIGAEVSGAMRAHTHDGHEWDQPEVPLEATLASEPPKPSISRFKAQRASHPAPSTSSLASHSLGAAVLPSSQSLSLKRAVRMGKMQNGKLLGGEAGDSEDEIIAEDENAREMWELLRRGGFTNVGPQSTHMPSPISSSQVEERNSPNVTAPVISEVVQPLPTAPKPRLSKVSKFKLSLSQQSAGSSPDSTLSSAVDTPVNNIERSSPKMSSRGGTPESKVAAMPSPATSAAPHSMGQALPTVANGAIQMPGMVVDSPSFLPPAGARKAASSAHIATSSPSFGSPAFRSAVMEAPSYQPSPGSTFTLSPPANAAPTISIHSGSVSASDEKPTALRQCVVERHPPATVSSQSQETANHNGAQGDERGHKVSRFKARRS